jgi:hypothetical protein
MRLSIALLVATLAAPLVVVPASAAPHKKKDPKEKKEKKEQTPEQKEADRHFKSGVALFGEQKFAEALAEFERAYEIAPNPIVLYNIASCHRELSHYAEAVKFYNRFLAETEGKDGTTARLTAAKSELDGILSRIARVTVTVPDGAAISVDGNALGTMPGLEMPLIVAPGEHKIVAKLDGKRDAEKVVRVASGDDVKIEIALVDAPTKTIVVEKPVEPVHAVVAPESPKHFRIDAGFGTNLQQVASSGVPDLGLGVAIGSRLELGVEVMFVAYAVMPSVRVRIAGDRASLHVIGAVPIAFTDGNMTKTFVAGAGGLGIRVRATPILSFHVEVMASYAGAAHGTTVPTFAGGELWF